MLDFALAARQMPLGQLSSSLQRIQEFCPSANVVVGICTGDSETGPFLDAAHPEVRQVKAEGLGALRSALVAAAESRYVVFVSPGTEITEATNLPAAIEAMKQHKAALLFATVQANSQASPWTTRTITRENRVFRTLRVSDAELHHSRVTASGTPGADPSDPLPADIGGDVFVVDTTQIGAGLAVDWDARFTDGFENRDLFASISTTPGIHARYLPTLVFERGAVHPVLAADDSAAMLATFLRKWGVHTERFGQGAATSYVSPGQYRGAGIRMTNVRTARAVIGAYRRNSTRPAQSLADALTKARFNPYVVSKSSDMLLDNMVVARDGSWIYVPVAQSGEEVVLAWLTELETGLAPRPWSGREGNDPNRLIRAREIGVARTVEFIESPNTLKFTFVNNPYLRIVGTFHDRYLARPLSSPAAEALRNLNGVADDSPYQLRNFLEDVAKQNDHERHREWRTQVTAAAWGKVPYDFVGRVENIDKDLIELAAVLGHRRPSSAIALSSTMDAARFAELNAPPLLDDRGIELIRRTYRDDFKRLEYSREVPAVGMQVQ